MRRERCGGTGRHGDEDRRGRGGRLRDLRRRRICRGAGVWGKYQGDDRTVVIAPVVAAVDRLVSEGGIGARATVVSGDAAGVSAAIDAINGTILEGRLPDEITEEVIGDARLLAEVELSATLDYDGVEVFIDLEAPPRTLLIVGAVHVGQALAAHAKLSGYRVVVTDPRPAFATDERFPECEILVGWPDDVADELPLDLRTFVAVLSHDARFEDPMWPLVLRSPVRYIGAMGSSKTANDRRDRLVAAGYSDEEIDRIHGPVGIDLGGDSADEIALSILAEMTSVARAGGVFPATTGHRVRIAKT
ncbi:MAG: xanthine dehydrogenase [Acidimicrobiia bacterium]|nr:xanthine dehydrogenase [Acidimicrobiia bacterium]